MNSDDLNKSLKTIDLPQLSADQLREISKLEGRPFLDQLSKAEAGDKKAFSYVSLVLRAVLPFPMTTLVKYGFKVSTRNLVDVAKQEGMSIYGAINALEDDEKREDAKSYLMKFFQMEENSDPESADHVGQSKEHAPQEQPREVPDAASSSSQPEDKRAARGRSFHVYGKRDALCFSEDTTQSGDSATVRIEGASATGPRVYDWKNKLTIQLSVTELLLVYAVFQGYMGKAKLSGHGPANDKFLEVEDQKDKIFVKLNQAQGSMHSVPIPGSYAAYITGMLYRQIAKNFHGLSDAKIEQIIHRMVAMYNGESQKEPARQSA